MGRSEPRSFFARFTRPAPLDLAVRLTVVGGAMTVAALAERQVAAERRMRVALEAESEKLSLIYEHNPAAVITLDDDFRVHYVNPAACAVSGWEAEELVGARCYEQLFQLEEPCQGCPVADVFATGEVRSRTKHERVTGGKENWLHQVWYPVRGLDGSVEQVVEIARDVRGFNLDPLTGLPNRLLFLDRLELALAGAHRREGSVAVLYMDIDGFKGVNDEYGHAAGDRVLEAVSGALASVLREDDSLARLGGDEFAVLLGEVSGRAQVAEVARRLIGAVEGLERVEDAPVRLGLSVGICMSTGEQGVERADPWRVIERADEAMYEAKERGGGYSFG